MELGREMKINIESLYIAVSVLWVRCPFSYGIPQTHLKEYSLGIRKRA
jgi:hypothetical protein